jgi:hypothetical protein
MLERANLEDSDPGGGNYLDHSDPEGFATWVQILAGSKL